MKRPIRAIVLTLGLCGTLPLAAADQVPAAETPQPAQYGLGDQTMSINAGLFVPLFLLPGPTILLDGTPPHLSLGAVGSLSWAAYVSPTIRVGIEVAGDFTVGRNGNALLQLPFIAKGSWVFTAYPFEIPVSLGVGMNLVKYVDSTMIDLLVRPGVAGYWIFNSSWSFGLNVNWWMDFMFAPTPADSRVGNFLEVSLAALYHF